MVLNPAGFVQAFDFGTPQIITAKAKAQISGGQFVYQSGAASLSSGLNSFVASDIEVTTGASGANFLGIAVANVESGAYVPVALGGVFVLTANATVTNSVLVGCDGNDSVLPVGSVAANLSAQLPIGRAVTTGASGGYLLVHIK